MGLPDLFSIRQCSLLDIFGREFCSSYAIEVKIVVARLWRSQPGGGNGSSTMASGKIDPGSIYQQLGALLVSVPDFRAEAVTSPEAHRWLARAAALVEAQGDITDAASLRVAIDYLPTSRHTNSERILAILNRALVRAELAAPAAIRGTFVQVGEFFTAMSAISRVLEEATSSILFVDAYADANLLSDYVVHAPEKIKVRILSDATWHKPGLGPATAAWCKEYGNLRPLEVRVAPAGALHDRLILIDEDNLWQTGQSFNGLAKRSPTTFSKIIDAEILRPKTAFYEGLWEAATPLI